MLTGSKSRAVQNRNGAHMSTSVCLQKIVSFSNYDAVVPQSSRHVNDKKKHDPSEKNKENLFIYEIEHKNALQCNLDTLAHLLNGYMRLPFMREYAYQSRRIAEGHSRKIGTLRTGSIFVQMLEQLKS